MRRVISLAVLFMFAGLVSIAWGGTEANFTGYTDSCFMHNVKVSTTTTSTKTFNLSKYDAVTIICMAKDTAEAGFAGDSLNFRWGIRPFNLCLDSTGAADTCYGQRVVIDTMILASLGTIGEAVQASNGTFTWANKTADTISCKGWAVQVRKVPAEVLRNFQFAQIYVTAMTNHAGGNGIDIMFTVMRRMFTGTRVMNPSGNF